MRILEVYASFFPESGGVEVHMRDLCKCLASRGHEVTVLSYTEAGSKSEVVDGIEVVRIKIPNILRYFRYPGLIVLSILLGYFAWKGKFDVVHVHGYLAAMAGALVRRTLDRPVVATFHLAPRYTDKPLPAIDLLERRLRGQLMSYLDVIINVSKFTLCEVRKSGIRSDNLVLIWNWVPFATIHLEKNFRGRAHALPKNPNKAITIVSVGRLSLQKGFDILIRAVSSLIGEGLNLRISIVGDGPERSQLARLCEELGLQKHIELTGRLSDQEKFSLVKSSDIFVLSSRFEGLPLTILEAMYLAKPVIATDVNGVGEIITNGYDGILVKPDKESLSSALRSVAMDSFLRNKIAENGRKTVESKFSSDNCKRTVFLLESLNYC